LAITVSSQLHHTLVASDLKLRFGSKLRFETNIQTRKRFPWCWKTLPRSSQLLSSSGLSFTFIKLVPLSKKKSNVEFSLQMIGRYIASCHQTASLFLLKSTTYEREILSANDQQRGDKWSPNWFPVFQINCQ
jgi:hypothetical protein